MGALMASKAADALSDQQRRFVDAITSGQSKEDAAKIAGYSESTYPAHILRSGPVQAALNSYCDAQLAGELRLKALATIETLLGDPTPSATRFQAAKLVLEHGEEAKQGDKALSEMTEAELMAVIDRAEQAVNARLKPPIIDVTPGNGAQQDGTAH